MKRSERSKRRKGGPPGEGARSEAPTVRTEQPDVKALDDTTSPVVSAGKRAAETRRREEGYRARVAAARAREQAAQARLALRRAETAAAAVRVARTEAAISELEAAEAALPAKEIEAEGKTDAEKQAIRDQVLAKRFEAQLAGRPQLGDVREIRLGREILEERVAHYYVKAREDGKIKPLSEKHATGKTWRHESRVRTGAVVDRFVGRFLRENEVEGMVRRLIRAAEKAKRLQPDGNLFMSFSIVEYGRGVPKSPGPQLYADALGSAYQAYDGTGHLGPASDIAGFAERARALLEQRLRSAGSANAILIDSFEVKSYRERTPEEEQAFVKDRRAKQKEMLARMKAERKGIR